MNKSVAVDRVFEKKKTTRDLKRRDIFMSRQMNILSAHINEQYKKIDDTRNTS